jgi:septum formation protein
MGRIVEFMTAFIQYKHILLLGSKSPSRQMLLNEAQIPFKLVGQDADERQCSWAMPLPQLVATIARHKMAHVVLPAGEGHGALCFVMTADTLSQDMDGTIHGKPDDRADAVQKIQSARGGSKLSTAFCIDRRVWDGNSWRVDERIEQVISAEYAFILPDEWIDIYFEKSLGLQTAGAIAAEGFGAQFMRVVQGSYTTIIGLPVYEVREALQKLGFFD